MCTPQVCEQEKMPICSTTYEQECTHSYEHGKQCAQKPQETCTFKEVRMKSHGQELYNLRAFRLKNAIKFHLKLAKITTRRSV